MFNKKYRIIYTIYVLSGIFQNLKKNLVIYGHLSKISLEGRPDTVNIFSRSDTGTEQENWRNLQGFWRRQEAAAYTIS